MDMKTVNQILNDSGTHDWVKQEYRKANQRDIVDALNDAEILLEMLKARFAQLTKEVA